MVCFLQGYSWLHGSRSSPEGHSVRQQRRLVLLRLHALQTPPRVTTTASPFRISSLFLLLLSALYSRCVPTSCLLSNLLSLSEQTSLNLLSRRLLGVCLILFVCEAVCVCLFDLKCVNAIGLGPVGQNWGKRGKKCVCVSVCVHTCVCGYDVFPLMFGSVGMNTLQRKSVLVFAERLTASEMDLMFLESCYLHE